MTDDTDDSGARRDPPRLVALRVIIERLKDRRGSPFGKRPHSFYAQGTGNFESQALKVKCVAEILDDLELRPTEGPEILDKLSPREQARLARIVDRFDRYREIATDPARCEAEFRQRLDEWQSSNAFWLGAGMAPLLAYALEQLRAYDFCEDPLVWLLPRLTAWVLEASRATIASAGHDLDALRKDLVKPALRLRRQVRPDGVHIAANVIEAIDRALLQELRSGLVPMPGVSLTERVLRVMHHDAVLDSVANWDCVDHLKRRRDEELEEARLRIELAAFNDLAPDRRRP